MISVSVEMARLTAALNRFADFRHRFKTSALRKMAATHKQQVRKRLLTTKAGPDGESWAPWKPKTEAKRRRKGNAGQGLLLDDRKLVNSFRVEFPQVGKGKLGSPLPYAAVLHFGNPQRNLVGRPYAGVGRTDMQELQRTLNDWVTSNLVLS